MDRRHELHPNHVKACQECQGHLSRAQPILQYLRDIGLPDEEGEKRHEYLSQMAGKMLEVHTDNVSTNRRRR